MTKPKPLTAWQSTLPGDLPRHIRRNITAGPDGCWLWARSRSHDGYGWASLDNRTRQAHRLVYALLRGEPDEGLILDHLCRVRHCVRPDHLEPVTPRENLERSTLTTTGMAVCARCGGRFDSVGQTKRQRRCMACQREWKREYAREYRRGLRRRDAA